MIGTAEPFFTVITVSFNSAATIADTLHSVAQQTGVSVEHIVVDGNSTDGTCEIVRRFAGAPTLISEPDRGLYDAMNKGVQLAKGRYIGFLNSDDYFASTGALAMMRQTLEGDGADAAWGNVVQVDQRGLPVRLLNRNKSTVTRFTFGLMPPHPAFYAKTELLRHIGGFKLDYSIASDFDLLLRLFMIEGFVASHVDELITVMRVGGVSTKGVEATRRISREMLAVLKSHGLASSPARITSRYGLRLMEVLNGRLLRSRGGRFYPPD